MVVGMDTLFWVVLAIVSLISLASVGVTLHVSRTMFASSPAELRRIFELFKEEQYAEFQKLRRDWTDTLEDIANERETAARERKKAQMDRGRAEKAREQPTGPETFDELMEVDREGALAAVYDRMRARGQRVI